MPATGWTGEPPDDGSPGLGGFTGAILAHRAAPGEGPTALERAMAAQDKPDEPFDNDEHMANLLARGYNPGEYSLLARRLADTEAELAAEAEKAEKSRRWEERVQRDHQAGRITAMDIARMWQEREEGDPGRIRTLERRAASLRGQLQDMTARICPPDPRLPDPVEEAGRRAHQAFVEATRVVLENGPRPRSREPRPFSAGHGDEGAPDCPECADAGASRSESAAIHAQAIRSGVSLGEITRITPPTD